MRFGDPSALINVRLINHYDIGQPNGGSNGAGMICRNCLNATIDKLKSDYEMAKQGYRSCAAAITPVDKAKYYPGGAKCAYPDRFKPK